MNANTIRIEYHEMRDILYKLFLKYKFTEKKALLMANEYTESTLVGVNSHGINRVPLFIEYIEKGIVKVDAEAEKKESFGSIERWDGNSGPGIINATKCTNRAVELAKKTWNRNGGITQYQSLDERRNLRKTSSRFRLYCYLFYKYPTKYAALGRKR